MTDDSIELSDILEDVRVEALILARHAEVHGGLLYLMGGGPDYFMVQAFPGRVASAVAVSLVVPWCKAEAGFQIDIAIDDADGRPVMSGLAINKAAGDRPPHAIPGQPFHEHLTFGFETVIPASGGYCLVARQDGKELARTPFQVTHPAQLRAS